jgi:hypothetical protein
MILPQNRYFPWIRATGRSPALCEAAMPSTTFLSLEESKMAKRRESVVGGVNGWLVSAVYAKIFADIRQGRMSDLLESRRTDRQFQAIPFAGAYEDSERGTELRAQINDAAAIYPELLINRLQVERVVTLGDTNPQEVCTWHRRIVGRVLVRFPDMGPHRPRHDRVVQYVVKMTMDYADNGNTCNFVSIVEPTKIECETELLRFANELS